MARQEQIKTERRRRDGAALSGFRNRLSIDAGILDTEKFAYRWINDVDGRVHDMTVRDDWEVVTDREKATGAGSEMAAEVGSGGEGSPLRAVLVRKPKEYFDADKAEKQRLIDEQEKSFTEAGDDPKVAPGTDSENLYQPRTKTSIRHG